MPDKDKDKIGGTISSGKAERDVAISYAHASVKGKTTTPTVAEIAAKARATAYAARNTPKLPLPGSSTVRSRWKPAFDSASDGAWSRLGKALTAPTSIEDVSMGGSISVLMAKSRVKAGKAITVQSPDTINDTIPLYQGAASLMANNAGDKEFIRKILSSTGEPLPPLDGSFDPNRPKPPRDRNAAMAQEQYGIEPNRAATLNDSSNESKGTLIDSSSNIAEYFIDEFGVRQAGFAIATGYVDGPDGAINFVEADIETAKSMMANSFFPPEQMVFRIDTSDEEFEKLVRDPKYSQYSIERSDTTEKKREREVARIEKRIGEEQVLVSPFLRGEWSRDELTMMGRYGVGEATPERKKQMYEFIEAAEKEFALTNSQYEMLLDRDKMSYQEIARETGMTDVAAHSLKQEIRSLIPKFADLVSIKSKREYHEDLSRVKEIMSKSRGPYSQARDDFKKIIKNSKSSPAEQDSAKRALARLNDPTRKVDDEVIAAYNANGKFVSSYSGLDGSDMVKDAFIKGGLKTISDRMATKEERTAAAQQIQAMAVAKTIKDTDLLKHLSTFDKNASYNKLVTDKVKLLASALARSSIDESDTVMNELINAVYEKDDKQGHKKGTKIYEILLGTGKVNPNTGKEVLEALKLTDDQKRQIFLTLCTPQAQSIMNAWNLVLDDPTDRTGAYSVDEDHVIQSINEMLAKGQEALARETVLNMRSIMKENGAIGLYGRSDKYLDIIDGMLGL